MDRSHPPVSTVLVFLAFLAALFYLAGAFWICAAQHTGPVILTGDQAYLDLLYVRNLRDGHGPRYLPDHLKTLAPASPLRVALLWIISHFLSLPFPLLWGAGFLGVVFLWLGLVLAAWRIREEGGGVEIGFLLAVLGQSGILWLLWSGDSGALVVLGVFACVLPLYRRDLTPTRLALTSVGAFLLGLCSWPGYAFALGTTLFLVTYGTRDMPDLRRPWRPGFWWAVFPSLGGGGILLLDWAWTGLWDGGGPLSQFNPLTCISFGTILRLEWPEGFFHLLRALGKSGTPVGGLSWILLPLFLFGLLVSPEKESEKNSRTELLPLFQILSVLAFLAFLPEGERESSILPFMPLFLFFVFRGIREIACRIPQVGDTVAWIVILGLVAVQVWALPNWYDRVRLIRSERYRMSVLPADEAKAKGWISDSVRVSAGDDPALLVRLGSDIVRQGVFGSGYRLNVNLAGAGYAGVKRDVLRLLLDAPDCVLFPSSRGVAGRSAFPDILSASAELVSASYEVRTGDTCTVFLRPTDVSVEEIRDIAAQRLLRAGREHDLLWSIIACDSRPEPTPEQRARWRNAVEDRLSCLAGEYWDFEEGLPLGSQTVGEEIRVAWTRPVPVDGVCALSTGLSQGVGSVVLPEFQIEGDLLQFSVAGIGSATECYVSLMIFEELRFAAEGIDPARKVEHFHHWAGESLRGTMFYYLMPQDLKPVPQGRQGWRVVKTAHPGNPDRWTFVEWPVHPWRGQRAHLEISDRSPESWIAVDSIRQMIRPPGKYFDFEDGTYHGWSTEGSAFGNGPALGAFPGQQPILRQQGDFLVNSYLDSSDSAQGVLRSATFSIDHEFLRFRIGGGDIPFRTALNLYVDGQPALSASGQRDEVLRTVVWDLRGVRGREGRIEIVDQDSDTWGHILVDDIALLDERFLSWEPEKGE
ncbi:MAG TPA: hypothetical protein PLQ35_02520 [bacterium]|nr:hypothetical protein [bacterium]